MKSIGIRVSANHNGSNQGVEEGCDGIYFLHIWEWSGDGWWYAVEIFFEFGHAANNVNWIQATS